MYYYTNFEKYSATHNWLFVERCFDQAVEDDEKSFCYGIAVHLMADSLAHQRYIPKKIGSTLVPNAIIHPISEGVIEAWTFNQDPVAGDMAKYAMDILFIRGNEKYLDMVDKAIGRHEQINVQLEASKLRTFLGAGEFQFGYYTISEDSWLYGLYGALGDTLGSMVGVEDASYYMRESEQITLDALNIWATRIKLEPTGAQALRNADTMPNIIMFGSIGTIIGLVGLLIYRKVKKR